jgi:hypothetical protein
MADDRGTRKALAAAERALAEALDRLWAASESFEAEEISKAHRCAGYVNLARAELAEAALRWADRQGPPARPRVPKR